MTRLLAGLLLGAALAGSAGASPARVVDRLDLPGLRQELATAHAKNVRLSRSATRFRQGWLKRGRVIKRMDRRIANLDRVARHGFDYPHLIHLASIAHGVNRAKLERKARCESVNFTDFYNDTPIHNGEHATGVMQFIPSTWRSTPYGLFDIYDPFANVLAGAWMHRVGRGGEWACR